MPAPLLAVDAPSLLYRAFFALPKSITGADGRPVNALLGTANLVLQAVERHAPRAVVLCFGAEAASYRVELYPGYHADRPPMPDELSPQWADARAFFGAFGWQVLWDEELEADDLLGSLATIETQAGGEALLFTGDRDMFQCVGEQVTVLFPGGGGKDGPVEIGPDGVRERYGIDPAQVPDFIALRGDPSDGLPGVAGIGEKTAATLLAQHGSLEAILAAAHDPKSKMPKAYRSKLLAATDYIEAAEPVVRVATAAPVTLSTESDTLPLVANHPPRVAELAASLGVTSSIGRLQKALDQLPAAT
jgi:5'-3' exonuclease